MAMIDLPTEINYITDLTGQGRRLEELEMINFDLLLQLIWHLLELDKEQR